MTESFYASSVCERKFPSICKAYTSTGPGNIFSSQLALPGLKNEIYRLHWLMEAY